MTPLEKQVWAAAFAAECLTQLEWMRAHGRSSDDVRAYTCAESADFAVDVLREALEQDEDNGHYPNQKGKL